MVVSENPSQLNVRDAVETDLLALIEIKGAGSEALHRDRFRDARTGYLRYLILLAGQNLIGSACLVFRRPPNWSDAGDPQHLPQVVDLQIKEAYRGQGYGTAFLNGIEQLAAAAGFSQLYLSVEPQGNPRAYALYLRLGYLPLQQEPYQKAWEFIDSAGIHHHGVDWVVDMIKAL